MADTKISALSAATTPLAGTEVLPIVQSGSTVKVTVNNMLETQSFTSPAVDSNGNVFLRATDTLGTGVGTQMMMGGKYNASAYVGFGGVAGRKENATSGNLAGYLDLLTCSAGGTIASRWRVDSSGNFNQRIAGTGVNFTANTSAAGMTSQLLNWYEEGTWTATLRGSVSDPTTPVTATGRYTRVGRLVTLTCSFDNVNTTGASGDVTVTGLPFNNSTPNTRTIGTVGGLYNFTITNKYVTCGMNENATAIYFSDEGSGTTGTALQHSAGPTRYIRFAITYYAA